MEKIKDWAEELDLFDDVMDRYSFLIDLAKKPTNLPSELRTEDRLVKGCMSQIWVEVGEKEGFTKIYYDSDALITKGVTHLICDCFNDLPVEQAKKVTKEDFEILGIEEILSSNRRNGLASLIGTIQNKIQLL